MRCFAPVTLWHVKLCNRISHMTAHILYLPHLFLVIGPSDLHMVSLLSLWIRCPLPSFAIFYPGIVFALIQKWADQSLPSLFCKHLKYVLFDHGSSLLLLSFLLKMCLASFCLCYCWWKYQRMREGTGHLLLQVDAEKNEVADASFPWMLLGATCLRDWSTSLELRLTLYLLVPFLYLLVY